jgi:hypothetical protein
VSEGTVRLALPLIEAGQAQKEVTHNEALAALDLLVQAGVVASGVNTPPMSPAPGQAWVVGSAPGGAWAGQAGAVAGWTAGGWRFLTPCEGTEVWCEADGCTVRFRGGEWETGVLRGTALRIDGAAVVGPRRAAIADPAGGATVDAAARSAIAAILAALRGHGLIAS